MKKAKIRSRFAIQNNVVNLLALFSILFFVGAIIWLSNIYLLRNTENRGQASTSYVIPPDDQRSTPPADAVLLNFGTGITNGANMNGGLFQVEGFCPLKNLGAIRQTNTDWYCGSYKLQVKDFDEICQRTYNNPNAYAIQDYGTPTPAYNWRCYVSTGASPTPTPSSTPTPTPSPTPSSITIINNIEWHPDMGIHRSCNQYCADSRECDPSLTCYYNQCRNPQNVTDPACAAAPAPVRHTTVRRRRTPSPSPSSDSFANVPSNAVITAVDNQPFTPSPSPSLLPVIAYIDASPSPAVEVTPTPDYTILNPSPTPTPTPSPSPTAASSSSTGNNLPRLAFLAVAAIAVLGVLFVLHQKFLA